MNMTSAERDTRRKRDWRKVAIHGLLIFSVLTIGFPLYYCFVMSTQSMEEVIQKPQKLLPSTHLLENYAKIWTRIDMGRLLINSAIVAITVSV